MSSSYLDDVKIQKHQLDEEWMRQSSLFAEYCDKLSTAQFEKDRAKERLEVAKAELDQEIRKNPGKFTTAKPTETVVLSLITTNEKVRSAHAEHLKTVHDVRVLEAAKESIRSKGDSLRNLTSLWMSNYFVDMNSPPDAVQQKMSDGSKQEHSDALNNSKRLIDRKVTE